MNEELREHLLLIMDGLQKLPEDRFQNLILFCAEEGLGYKFRDWIVSQMNREQSETLDSEIAEIADYLEEEEDESEGV